MNINDITIDLSQFKEDDYVQILFEKQDQLRKLYGVPICDIDVPSDQQQLRSMAWNVIEEAAEAIDVLWSTQHPDHILDELADMTSFYIELLLMSGLTSKETEFPTWGKEFHDMNTAFVNFAVSLSLTINTLKNRYWRRTNLQTDRELYYSRLKATIPKFKEFIQAFELSFNELFESYLRKHEVNLFRVRSHY